MRLLPAAPKPLRTGTSAETALRQPAYVWLFTLALVLNVTSGTSQFFGLALSPDRPLFLLAVVLVVLDPRAPTVRWTLVHAAMLATIGWTAWSWLATGSLSESAKAFALTDRIVVPFAMFVLGPIIFDTPGRRDLLLKVLTLLGIYLGLTSVFEIVGPSSLIFPRAIADPAAGIGFGRARGPFLASEPLGMACGLILFAALATAWRCPRWWRRIAIFSAVLCLCGVLLSLTRTAWIGTLIGMTVIGVLTPWLRRRLPAVAAGMVAALAAVQAVLPNTFTTIVERLTTTRSIYDRLNTNEAALRIIDQRPVTGIGWGRFLEVSSDWVRQSDDYPVTTTAIEIHNVFLSRAAETGLLGAVLWGAVVLLGPVAVLTRRAPTNELQLWRLLTVAALLIWILPTLSSPNPYPFPNNLVWLISGIAGHQFLVRKRSSARDT